MTPREELEALRAEFSQPQKPMTERQELEALRAEFPQQTVQQTQPVTPQQEEPEGFPGASVIEPAATVLSGVPAEILGGLSTLVPTILGDPDKAEANLKAMRALATYQPRTEAGQEGLQSLGETLEPVANVLQQVEDAFSKSGAQTFDALGLDPAVGAGAGAALPALLESLTGVKAGGSAVNAAKPVAKVTAKAAGSVIDGAKAIPGATVKAAKKTKGFFTGDTEFKRKIAQQIQEGSTDRNIAKYIVNGKGKVKTDKLAAAAEKQGFDKGVISVIKGAPRNDKLKLFKMVKVMEKGKNNSLFATKNRPTDVAGDSLLARVNHIKTINKRAGASIDRTAKSLRGKRVDFSAPIDAFERSLNDMGISIDPKTLKPIFKGSDIEGLAGPEAAIKNIMNRLTLGKQGTTPDAYALHRMKKYIDENVTFGKAGEGLKGKTERVLKELRANLDTTLDQNFPRYNKVNTIYSETVGALDSLQDVAGKKLDLFGPNADKATGTLLRRLMSNAQSRVNLVDAIDSLEGTAKKYGGKFDDDVMTQVLFADELDSVFGSVAKTSLAGETSKAVKAAEVALGQKTTGGVALEAIKAGIDKVRGINEEGAFAAIKELLKR